MSALGLLFYVESLGVHLRAEGSDIRFRAPEGMLNDSLKRSVRASKSELLKMLQARRKFGYTEAAFFPLLEKKVVTSQGPGDLLNVCREYRRVQLHQTGAVVLHRPQDLVALAVTEFTADLAA